MPIESEALEILRVYDGSRLERDPAAGTPDLLAFLLNDHGNAERLIAMRGRDMRFCHAFRKWLVWDGRRWAVDETDQSRKFAKQSMLEFLKQAVEKQAEQAEKFARGSLDARRISSLLSMAECELPILPAELDANPDLLNFLNVTVDLRSSECHAHKRADFITKLIHYAYRPSAKCERWQRFLDEVMGGGPDASEAALERSQRLVDYLQRALGYSLTGHTIEKAVFVLFGDEGDNGKTTLLSTVRQLTEEYSVLLQVDTLMVRAESNNTQADLADLRGARFVQTSETEEGQRLAQGKLKRITQGMGTIKAVRKYENPIEFRETHKLWIDTNRKPTIRDADDRATFNRLHPIPFLVSFPKDKQDHELPTKLLSEAEGILAWAVAGAKLWNKSGLNKPEEVEAAKNKWRSDMDQLGRFIGEQCVTGDGFRARASVIYANYKAWAEASGEPIMTGTAFGLKMPERGFVKKETSRGNQYLGIAIRSTDSEVNSDQ